MKKLFLILCLSAASMNLVAGNSFPRTPHENGACVLYSIILSQSLGALKTIGTQLDDNTQLSADQLRSLEKRLSDIQKDIKSLNMPSIEDYVGIRRIGTIKTRRDEAALKASKILDRIEERKVVQQERDRAAKRDTLRSEREHNQNGQRYIRPPKPE